MSGQDVDFDPVGLSFTDVLTCVFGAAIVLFLIFIALVVLDNLTGEIQGSSVGYSTKKMKSIQDEVVAGYASATLRIVAQGDSAKDVIQLLTINQFDNLAVSDKLNSTPLFDKQERFSNEVGEDTFHGLILSGKMRNINQTISISGTNPLFDNPTQISATIIVGGMAKTVDLVLTNASIRANGTTLFTYGPRIDQFIRSAF